MHIKSILQILISAIIFTIIFAIIFNHGGNIPYYTNNITDYALNITDKPFKKEILAQYDLSINLLIFLAIFFFIQKKFDTKISKHLQFIWLIKSFISLFVIMIFETSNGLDQTQYYIFVSNSVKYYWHFGNLDNLFDLHNSTVNFLLPLKFVNFIFNDSWFIQKNFQNILYFISLIYFYKTIILINPKLKYNVSVLYFYSFLPSFLFFSSFITKDFLVISLLSIFTFNLINLSDGKKILSSSVIIIASIIIIYLLRSWIAFAMILVLSLYFTYILSNKIRIFNISLFSIGLILFLLGVYLIINTTYIIELEWMIFDRLFDRIKTEHWYAFQSTIGSSKPLYDTLFVNVGTKLDLIYYYPVALAKTVFNPFLEKIMNIKLLIFVLENLFLFLLIIYSIKNLKKNFNISFLPAVMFVIILTHLYIPIGYLNSGTTLRYSLQIKFFILLYLVPLNYELFLNIDKFIRYFLHLNNWKTKK